MDLRKKLIAAAKRYTDKVLEDFRKSVSEEIKINVYISGSVSYGYCDEMSDIEMEFFLPNSTGENIKERLQEIIDCNGEFEGIRMSAGVSGWQLEKILSESPGDFWKDFNPYQMYELVTALPIREDLPLIDEIKQKVNFYPDELFQKVVKGLWITSNDNGPYNAGWSYKRRQFFASNIFFYRSMEAILRLAYILNRKYYPHTKWLERGLGELKNNFGLINFIQKAESLSLEEKLKAQEDIIKKIGAFMVKNSILNQRFIEHPWDLLDEDYYIFSTF